MKLSRGPSSRFVLVSMDQYCQERATRVLNDFAAFGTFLLNCEQTVFAMAWVVSQVTEPFDASAFFVAWAGVYFATATNG
jgi:hypothetical protein